MIRLVVTGGGTGGHVFPAVETALGARERGWDVHYFGSVRGQESRACDKVSLPFTAFESGPVYKPLTSRGMKSLLALLKATKKAKSALRRLNPSVVFATGGYAAAPVLNAARVLGIPIVLHEQNSVPGRTNKLMSRVAYRVCTVFEGAAQHFPTDKVVRTGMPVRREIREGGQGSLMLDSGITKASPLIVVVGGSQGSAALNDLALSTAVRMAQNDVQWFHLTGLNHFDSTAESLRKMGVRSDYVVKPYVEADVMAAALFQSTLNVCRSGAGTLSELAALRRPAILVPYPHAFGDHQTANAREFEALGAAEVVKEGDVSPAQLEARILAWLDDPERIKSAQSALAKWDVPDAVPRILDIIEEAARQ